MAPRKKPTKRKSPISRDSESDATAQFDQLLSERLAAAMPEFVSKISENILQTLRGSSGGGTGTGSDGSGGSGAGGAGTSGGKTVILDDSPSGCSYKSFVGCKPPEFTGLEGATGTLQWMEKVESVFEVSGCAEESKVSFATFLFQGLALTWWNTIVRTRGRAEISTLTWEQLRAIMTEEYVPEHEIERLEQELWSLEMQGTDIRGYTNRFYELSQLIPHLVRPESKRISRYIHGLPQPVRGNVIASRPGTLQSAIVVASLLVDSWIRDGAVPSSVGKSSESKRVREPQPDDAGRKKGKEVVQSYAAVSTEKKGYSGPWPKCNKCSRHHLPEVACWECTKCKMLGHTEKFCRTCFDCEKPDHRKDRCPKLVQPVGDARGRVFMLGSQ